MLRNLYEESQNHPFLVFERSDGLVRFFPSFDLGTRARAEQRAAAADVESRLAPSLAAHAARSGRSVPPGIDRGKERRKEGRERER